MPHRLQHSAARVLDYDLHGIVGIRLVNAAPAQAAALARQIGAVESALKQPPDVVIRFVDRLPTSSRICYLGRNTGVSDDALVLLDRGVTNRPLVRIPFADIGRTCEITCEHGVSQIPLLVPIVNLTAMGKGYLPLHASAFGFSGGGAIAAGLSRGGKTGTLLAFMAHGASYIGDDWVYVAPDGDTAFGLPGVMEVRHAYLQALPQYHARLDWSERGRLRALALLQRLERVIPDGTRRPTFGAGLRYRARAALERRLFVHVSPQQLFGPAACPGSGRVSTMFVLFSHDAPDVTVRRIEPQDAVRHLMFSLRHEWLELVSYYLQFRFALPSARNELLEEHEERLREALARALRGKDTYAVGHPSPVPVAMMYAALSPLFPEQPS